MGVKHPVYSNLISENTYKDCLIKMDSLKDKLGGSESPEERKARKRKLLPLNVGSLVISIVMVVIGAQVC
jgi:hypothetical protein